MENKEELESLLRKAKKEKYIGVAKGALITTSQATLGSLPAVLWDYSPMSSLPFILSGVMAYGYYQGHTFIDDIKSASSRERSYKAQLE